MSVKETQPGFYDATWGNMPIFAHRYHTWFCLDWLPLEIGKKEYKVEANINAKMEAKY